MRKIQSIQNAIVQWLSNKRSKNEKMPEALRRDVCALAARIGVSATCKELSIQRSVVESGRRSVGCKCSTPLKPRFLVRGELVEVQMPQWSRSRVKMSNRFGESMELELPQAEVARIFAGFFRGGSL